MPKQELAECVGRYPPDVQELALHARKVLLELLPRAQETVDNAAGVVGYGYGTGYSDTICTLILSRSGVKLGLVGGATLADPEGLLEGKGRVHRHIQLHSRTDLSRSGVRKLVLLARAAWQTRSEERPRTRK